MDLVRPLRDEASRKRVADGDDENLGILQAGLTEQDWATIRERAYEGRGG